MSQRRNWLSSFDAPPIVGMLHVPPLPGAPGFDGDAKSVRRRVLDEARILVQGGVHALLLENFGDAPFFPSQVPPSTVAWMTALAVEVRRRFDVPLGINVLRNDALAALAVAQASGASFIRVNVLCGVRVTDQGLITGRAHELLRERVRLGAEGIAILADVDVKHSAALAPRPLSAEVAELVERGKADGLIVTGTVTGEAVDADHLTTVRQAAPSDVPVLVGSGVTADSLPRLFPHADGFIVGTALHEGGRIGEPVNADRVARLMEAWSQARTQPD